MKLKKFLKDKLGISYMEERSELIDSIVVGKEGDIKVIAKRITDFVKKHKLSNKEEKDIQQVFDREIEFYRQRRK